MGVFEYFPYANFHDLNLDWIVHELKKLTGDVRDFISINAIKYADPIQWDITSQYEKNTVVLDKDGNAYLSVQPVPAGVSLDRTEYWTNIGNFSALWESVKQAITIPDEGHETAASAPRAVHDLVWVNGQLLEVLLPMIAGDQYVVGSNCRVYSMQIMLTELLSSLEQLDTAIQNEQTAREEAIQNEQTAREEAIQNEQTAREAAIQNEQTAREAEDAALEKKVAGTINVATYNPSADGTLHLLSERFSSLEDAQAVFPAAEALTDSIDWAAIQSAFNYAKTTGYAVEIPAGVYIVNKTLDADFSNGPFEIRGNGSAYKTMIKTLGTLDIVLLAHGIKTTPFSEAGNAGRVTISNLSISGYNKNGTGLRFEFLSFFELRNIYCYDFEYGIILNNTDHGVLYRVSTRWNIKGLYAGSQNFIEYTGINNISCFACVFGNNDNYGAEFFNCANITIIGTSIEYNGQSATNRDNGGLIAYKYGGQGSTGINVISCYLEGNRGFGDIILDNQFATDANFSNACNIIGCTFNKVQNSETAATIFLLGNGNSNVTKLSVIGCGEKKETGYTTPSGTKFVRVANQSVFDNIYLENNMIDIVEEIPDFDIQNSKTAWCGATSNGTTSTTDIPLTSYEPGQGLTIGNNDITITKAGFYNVDATVTTDNDTTFTIVTVASTS